MKTFTAIAALVALAGAAHADGINFDDLAAGTMVTTQYAGVTFSSIAGQVNMTHSFTNGGNSAPNILCSADAAGAVNCLNPTFIDFAQPVINLSFLAVEPNGEGEVASINIYQSGSFTTNLPLIGLGSGGEFGAGNVPVDLSAFSNITRIELVGPGGSGLLDGAGNGIGWDNFNYSFVPAPASLALLGLGGLIGGRRRR